MTERSVGGKVSKKKPQKISDVISIGSQKSYPQIESTILRPSQGPFYARNVKHLYPRVFNSLAESLFIFEDLFYQHNHYIETTLF